LVGDGNYHSLHSGNLALRRFITQGSCIQLHREVAGLTDDVGPFLFAGC
jgi:hypothetical protein